MTARHLKLLVLLLPLLVARSLLPIGFMLSFDEGVPSIVFCPGQITVPTAPAGSEHSLHMAHHGHEHHHGGHQSEERSTDQDHQSCPFAFAAAAPCSVANAFAAEPPAAEAIPAPSYSTVIAPAYRAHPIRGPPALS